MSDMQTPHSSLKSVQISFVLKVVQCSETYAKQMSGFHGLGGLRGWSPPNKFRGAQEILREKIPTIFCYRFLTIF